MKRYIKSNQRIYGMALDRKTAIHHLEKYSEPLVVHIIKCVMYGDSTGNFFHWVNEICEYLDYANNVTTKPNGKKMKVSDYLSTIFADMGNSPKDAALALKGFKIDYVDNQKYPDFKIDSDYIDRLFNAFNAIKKYMIPILTTTNDLCGDDFIGKIYNILR